MTCLECALAIRSCVVCLGCGVGLCMAHAIVEPRYLNRTAVINRAELVEPPARVVHCAICASAEEAQTRLAGRRPGRR